MSYSMDDIFQLKDRYQNGSIKIGDELIKPCLSLCTHYRRGTGFFSSSALKTYIYAIDNIISEKVKIDILCSPVVTDKRLLRVLELNKAPEERIKTIRALSERIVLIAVGFKQNPNNVDYRSKLLSYMIAKGQLEIRFAIPKNFSWPTEEINDNNLYHVKMGYFEFDDGVKVAFDGSFNESNSGHTYHVDRTQVYRSWVDTDIERLNGVIQDIDQDWGDDKQHKNNYIAVYELSSEAIELIKKLSPQKRPRQNIGPLDTTRPSNVRSVAISAGMWDHQKKAINEFLEKRKGVLEMATGSGKTTTALEIMRQLYLSGKIKSIIISTYGNDLLEQWFKEITKWQTKFYDEGIANLKIFRSFKTNKDALSFLNDSANSILLISRDASGLRKIFTSSSINKESTLIIHDEVHGFGSPKMIEELQQTHRDYAYRLGLSATPEREYDIEGTKLIENEIGPVIFKFPLEEAIKAGILCEFNYIYLPFELTVQDRNNYKKVFSRKANDQRNGKPWSEERLAIELSKIVKKAELKPFILNDFLKENKDVLKSCIIFVLDKEQGDSICNTISKYTTNYRTYYAGTDKEHLDKFISNKLDCLVACERLNEGVDIQALKNIILVASPKSKLDTIQRLGRCLRIDPQNKTKVATVVDFVLEKDKDTESKEDNSDQIRKKWLESLAYNRRVNNGN